MVERSVEQERRFADQVEAWLAARSHPDRSVVWYRRWARTRSVVASDATHLGILMSGLDVHEFAGIKRPGGSLHWAQVKRENTDTVYLELHPYDHDLAVLPFVWASLPELSVDEAALRAWLWVHS